MEAKTDTISALRLSDSSAEGTNLLSCPTCDKKLRRNEIFQHFEQEMELLRHLQMKAVNADLTASASSTSEPEVESGAGGERRSKPWNVFQRIQQNRQSRLKLRTRKRPLPPPPEQPCPVCNVSYPQDEIQHHAENCLRRNNANSNGLDDNSSDDEYNGDDTEEYEEYEWAGQKRIRIASLLQGGYASLGIGQTIANNRQQEDEEEDLNVDEDDTQIYGPVQYGENDIIPATVDQNGSDDEESNVTNYMRRLITVNTQAQTTLGTANTENKNNNSINATHTSHSMGLTTLPATATATTSKSAKSQEHYIIDALKAKLRQYENQLHNKFKCLICLDDYRNPAISVSCWHVHCEECWLRSLGARKLCPQCNVITTPKDLRRIYM